MAERPTTASARTSGENKHVRLTRLSDNDDIEAYLTTFERMMEAYEIERACWSFKLAPQLTGKAQQAYAALPPEHAKDYDEVKAAILRRYNINEKTYRPRFRSQKLKDGETPRELVTRLSDLVSRWTKDCSSVDDMKDLMVKNNCSLPCRRTSVYGLPSESRRAVQRPDSWRKTTSRRGRQRTLSLQNRRKRPRRGSRRGSVQGVAPQDTGRVNAPIREQDEMRPDHSGTLNLGILKE